MMTHSSTFFIHLTPETAAHSLITPGKCATNKARFWLCCMITYVFFSFLNRVGADVSEPVQFNCKGRFKIKS